MVGCGLAAQASRNPCVLTILRIDDGLAWYVPCTESGNDWTWLRALGITCDEVFVVTSYSEKQRTTIARVRIDSLGEPVPPD